MLYNYHADRGGQLSPNTAPKMGKTFGVPNYLRPTVDWFEQHRWKCNHHLQPQTISIMYSNDSPKLF